MSNEIEQDLQQFANATNSQFARAQSEEQSRRGFKSITDLLQKIAGQNEKILKEISELKKGTKNG